MTFKMPELKIITSNLNFQTFYQKEMANKTSPVAFHLLNYYARRNELDILKRLHSKLSDPQKKLHQKMLMDAIVREQLAIR
jgi:hypothetical protein